MADIDQSTDPIDFDFIRANAVQRIIDKLKLISDLKQAMEALAAHPGKESLLTPGRRNFQADVNGLMNHIELLQASAEADLWHDTSQLGFLIARDVIAAAVRAPQGGLQAEPVVFLTGNRYMPPCRSFDDMEAIWQEDEEGTYFQAVWERVEECLPQHDIYIGVPEYDNCIYGVDLRVWEPSEAAENDEPVDSLNDEWSRKDGV